MGFLLMCLNTHTVLWEIIGSENITHLSTRLQNPARSRNFRQQDVKQTLDLDVPCCLPISVCCLWRQHLFGFRHRQRGSMKKLRSSGCTCYIAQMINLHRCENTDWFSFFEKVTSSDIQSFFKNQYNPVCSWWFSLSLDLDVAFSVLLWHRWCYHVFFMDVFFLNPSALAALPVAHSADTWCFVSHSKRR